MDEVAVLRNASLELPPRRSGLRCPREAGLIDLIEFHR
jgi:hypothetical protein